MMNACSACMPGKKQQMADTAVMRVEGWGRKWMMLRHHMLYMCLTVYTQYSYILHGICVTEKLRLTVSCARQVCMHQCCMLARVCADGPDGHTLDRSLELAQPPSVSCARLSAQRT